MYKDSTSPWASPLVIAPKATASFIRFFDDYRWLNGTYSPFAARKKKKAMKWSITTFGNMLLLAHDKRDACDKLEKFLERCIKDAEDWIQFCEMFRL